MNPSSCVVLVPVGNPVVPGCEESLRELERRGYPVRRIPGFSAIDIGRSVMVSNALREGFDEIMWIDADVAFNPDDVDTLRARNLPIVCGLYPKKGPRQFACDFLPGTQKVTFGRAGGLTEIRYAGFGFTLVRREVFDAVRTQLALPECNQRFGPPIVPYFLPIVVPDDLGHWYLAEDYAFCERARQCEFKVMADTSIRLWHVGTYNYGWEDAGADKDRFHTYTFHLPTASPTPSPPTTQPHLEPATSTFTQDWFSYHVPLWDRLLARYKGKPARALEVGVFEGRSTVWLLENILTHPDAKLIWVDTFAGGSDHAGMDLTGLEQRFLVNTARFKDKLTGLKGRSQDRLKELPAGSFDLAYIDGSHEAADVLADAVLVWPLVKPGGLVGFDDYGWAEFPEPDRNPGPAIDAFLAAMRGRYDVLHQGYQVWVRKVS